MDNGYFVYPDDNNCLKITEEIQNVYKHTIDDTSKKIYINRLLYSMTLDLRYIREVILFTQIGVEFEHKLNEIGVTPILIYGAGKRGTQLSKIFLDRNWVGYIDKNKRGCINNLEIKPLEEYSNYKECAIIISNCFDYQQIREELVSKGIDKQKIIVLEEWNKKAAKEQYFESRCIHMDKISGGFVDAGAYDGTDSINYTKIVKENNNYKIWAFEPDKTQYKICKTSLSHLNKVNLYNIAISDKCYGGVRLVQGFNGGSYIDNSKKLDGMEVNSKSLDELLLNEKIGYIKMDIEGYESKALHGCLNILRDQKPALAISIYHKRSDIFEIPKLILEFNPEYKFAFGHYSLAQVDTVLYAF